MEKKESPELEFQTHESGTKYYIIPLQAGSTGEKKILRIFQSNSPGRLEFENFDEYYVRRRFSKEEDKKRKRGTVFWHSSQWGSMTPQKAIELIEKLNNKSESNES